MRSPVPADTPEPYRKEAHNRKPNSAAWWKEKRWRHNRRHWNRRLRR